MPSRKVHVVTSSAVGVLFALHKSRDQPEPFRLIEAVGGFFGGYGGGRFPDVLEPPTTPRHRGTAHSIAAVGTALKLSERQLDRWQRTSRAWADDFRAKQMACPEGSLPRLFFQLAELACRLLAGAIAGLLSGFLMHLALDAGTPWCLNII